MKLLILLVLASYPCFAEDLNWIHQTERQIISGDIVHWGTGTADSPDNALFKARQMATKSILMECGGFAHKDIIPRKSHVEDEGRGKWQAYAQVDISFTSCVEAKRGQGQENKTIIEDQKIYANMLKGQKEKMDEIEVQDMVNAHLRSLSDAEGHSSGADEEEEKFRNINKKRKQIMEQPQASSSAKQSCYRRLQFEINQMRMQTGSNGNEAYMPQFNGIEHQKEICASL